MFELYYLKFIMNFANKSHDYKIFNLCGYKSNKLAIHNSAVDTTENRQ